MKEICICAAVKTTDGQIIRGHRHSDCIAAIVSRGKKILRKPDSQGFITSKNRFVDRKEGNELMKNSGIPSKYMLNYGSVLFSEDLY